MPIPQKLSKEEIQQQLFDALMEQIEPKLMTSARKQTAAELAAMEPEEREQWMKYYQSAYEEFMDQWPKFVANAIGEMRNMGDALIQIAGKADVSAMKNIEKSFGDASSPSVSA